MDNQTRGWPNAPSPPSQAMRVALTSSVSGASMGVGAVVMDVAFDWRLWGILLRAEKGTRSPR